MKKLLLLTLLIWPHLIGMQTELDSPTGSTSSTSSDTLTSEEQSSSLSLIIYGKQDPFFKLAIKKALEKKPKTKKQQDKRFRCESLLASIIYNYE